MELVTRTTKSFGFLWTNSNRRLLLSGLENGSLLLRLKNWAGFPVLMVIRLVLGMGPSYGLVFLWTPQTSVIEIQTIPLELIFLSC